MRPDAARRGERGFTLLEVLVAFIIAALAMGVMFDAVLGGLKATENASQYQEAVSLARSHIASVALIDLAAREEQGDDGRGFHYKLKVVPRGTVAMARNANDDPGSSPVVQVTLYAISVAESWKSGAGEREVTLDTQRLGTGAAKGR